MNNKNENKSNLIWAALIATVIFTTVACNGINNQQIAEDFKKANPDAKLIEQFIGEGDSDNAYVYFIYTKGNSTDKVEEVWLYQRQKDKSWKVLHKEGPKPAGSKFGD